MEVTCERCGTRYEFEDALVSEKGTTVKCSTCGHQFRVFRPSAGGVSRWVVRYADGTEQIFEAMRELQSAILSGEVSPEDMLVTEGKGERKLSTISELGDFFSRASRRQTQTTPGLGREPNPARSGNTLRPPGDPAAVSDLPRPGPPRATQTTRRQMTSRPPPPLPGSVPPPPVGDDEPTPIHEKRTADVPDHTPLAGTPVSPSEFAKLAASRQKANLPDGVSPTADPEGFEEESTAIRRGPKAKTGEAEASPTSARTEETHTLQTPRSEAPAAGESEPPPSSQRHETGEAEPEEPPLSRPAQPPGPPPVAPVEAKDVSDGSDLLGDIESMDEPEISSLPALTPSPSIVRPSVMRRSYTGPRFTTHGPATQRPGFGRWVISLLVLGSLIVGGFIWLQSQNAANKQSPPPQAVKTTKDPRVEQLLGDADKQLAKGDLDGARETYLKASAISTEPSIAQGLARIALIQADETWLHLRLLTEKEGAARTLLETQHTKRLTRARAAMTKLDKGSNAAPATSAIDVLRVDLLRLTNQTDEARAQTAKLQSGGADAGRALAALDLVETRFDQKSVLSRLSAATRAEQGLGRAHSFQIYALALAGRKKQAEAQLASFAEKHPEHALTSSLKQFVARAKQRSPQDDSLGGTASSAAAATNGPPKDFRDALRRARAAQSSGDLANAQAMYEAALSKSPGNSEALAGLAQVAQARGDSATAASRYREVLKQNPGYVPALMSLADILWASGSRGEAVGLYQQVVQSAGGTGYGQRAQERIDAASKPKADAPPPATTTPVAPAGSSAGAAASGAAPSGTATAPPSTPSATTAKPAPTPAPAPTPSAPSGKPDIDLTDLPEFQ